MANNRKAGSTISDFFSENKMLILGAVFVVAVLALGGLLFSTQMGGLAGKFTVRATFDNGEVVFHGLEDVYEDNPYVTEGQTFKLYLAAGSGMKVNALSLKVDYDPAVFSLKAINSLPAGKVPATVHQDLPSIEAGGASGWSPVAVSFSMPSVGLQEYTADSDLLELVFEVEAARGSSSDVSITDLVISSIETDRPLTLVDQAVDPQPLLQNIKVWAPCMIDPVAGTCTDEDGVNYFECTDKYTADQFECQEDGCVAVTGVKCAPGDMCGEKGTCIFSGEKCIVEGGGEDFFTFSSVMVMAGDKKRTSTDTCKDTGTLFEYACDEKNERKIEASCAMGRRCVEGECAFVKCGDVNNDGVFNSLDVSLLERAVGKVIDQSTASISAGAESVQVSFSNADLNADSKVNADDLSVAASYLIGQTSMPELCSATSYCGDGVLNTPKPASSGTSVSRIKPTRISEYKIGRLGDGSSLNNAIDGDISTFASFGDGGYMVFDFGVPISSANRIIISERTTVLHDYSIPTTGGTFSTIAPESYTVTTSGTTVNISVIYHGVAPPGNIVEINLESGSKASAAVTWSEECDDGNFKSNDGCSNMCTIEAGWGCSSKSPTTCTKLCGNSKTDTVGSYIEICDEGTALNGQPGHCSADCMKKLTDPVCGNGVPEGDETCDFKSSSLFSDSEPGACRTNCQWAHCGDNVMDPSMGEGIPAEECDDGTHNTNLTADACRTDCKKAFCGDGMKDTGEECDYGAGNSDNGECTSTCHLNVCGDGLKLDGVEYCDEGALPLVPDGKNGQPRHCARDCKADTEPSCGNRVPERGEVCDDGNENELVCTSDCTLPACGDGKIGGIETCDDGNQIDGDSCKNNCQLNVCGDSVAFTGKEECDDVNKDETDACNNDCKFTTCGDGITQIVNGLGESESCDSGKDNGQPKMCAIDCRGITGSICNNVIIEDGEDCDDGAALNGYQYACTALCQDNVCGDGFKLEGENGEQCDDGNLINGDGCSSACAIERCGDGVQQASEKCDDGNTASNDGCSSTCTIERCGDGIQQASEQCDDGNNIDNDGCSSACAIERCGDGVQQTSEQCDDGNQNNNDGCSSVCRNEVCGDNIKQTSEGCDDGNTESNDGCSSGCKTEFCGDSVKQISEQCDGQQYCLNTCMWKDTDEDRMPDYWEIQNNLLVNDRRDATSDPDNDGANNLYEYQKGTNPNSREFRVFVTSATYHSYLRSADSACSSLASGKLPGTYRAWLSDNAAEEEYPHATDVQTRFTKRTVPYYLPDMKTKVADNFADLTDGTILNGINQTETGAVVAATNTPQVWTGTEADGTSRADGLYDCAQWANSDLTTYEYGIFGDFTKTNDMWTYAGTQSCTALARLYCFQTDR